MSVCMGWGRVEWHCVCLGVVKAVWFSGIVCGLLVVGEHFTENVSLRSCCGCALTFHSSLYSFPSIEYIDFRL